jgi:hypothetical protein
MTAVPSKSAARRAAATPAAEDVPRDELARRLAAALADGDPRLPDLRRQLKDTLARLDGEPVKAALAVMDEANGAVRAAQAAVSQAEADQDLYVEDLRRRLRRSVTPDGHEALERAWRAMDGESERLRNRDYSRLGAEQAAAAGDRMRELVAAIRRLRDDGGLAADPMAYAVEILARFGLEDGD